MGLLDSLLSPSTYGGQPGGLLDMLQSSLMQQNSYQPSAGFPQQQPGSGRAFDSATFDPATFAPSQPSNSIAVGGYQMPRIGSPDQFQSQQAMIPPNAQPTQGQMQPQQPPQPQQQQLPPALGGNSFGGNFGAGLQNFVNAGGPLQAIAGGISGLMTGQRTDAQGMAQQNLKAQYDSLVPVLGPQKAMLAVMNPEAGKVLLGQALEKHQYGFTKMDDGTILRQDPATGKVEPAYSATPKADFGVINEQDGQKTYGWIDKNQRSTSPVAGVEPRTNSITGPDGKQIAIPEGVDRKTFVNEVSRAGAKAAAGEKTEVQAKSEKFGNKMELAEKNITKVEDELTGYRGRALDNAPLIGGTMATNWLQSDKYQQAKQARDNFITALLRDESGAAIGTSEFQRYEKELFPQPGDSGAVIQQKRQARQIAIEAMKKSAGPGYKSPNLESTAAASAPADPLGIR